MHKRFFHLFAVVGLALLLAACESGSVVPESVVFFTNQRVGSEGGRSVICDNRTTEITYEFTYRSSAVETLSEWTQALVGETSGDRLFERRFVPSDSEVSLLGDQRFRVETSVPVGSAPLSVNDDSVDSQAIIIVPNPQVIGRARLEVTVVGSLGTTQRIIFPWFDVIDNCR